MALASSHNVLLPRTFACFRTSFVREPGSSLRDEDPAMRPRDPAGDPHHDDEGRGNR